MPVKQSINDYKISNIKPFCDVWYKDCYHSSLFPIINKFIGTIKPFILREVFLYDYEDCHGIPVVRLLPKEITEGKTIYTILDEMGIRCEAKIASTHITEDLKEAILQDKPVIAGVDCFYESIRKDAYEREHIAHSLLVYGFQEEDRIFNIIEHNFRFSIEFTEKEINYNEMKNAYNGFLENLSNINFVKNKLPVFCEIDKVFPSFYTFEADGCLKTGNMIEEAGYIKAYIKFILNNKDLLADSLKNLKNFKEAFIHFISKDFFIEPNITDFFDGVNAVINNKKVEKYVFSTVFGMKEEALSCLNSVIDSWSAIRGFLAKCMYSQVRNPRHINTCVEHINHIYAAEVSYYDTLRAFYNSY